MEIPIECTRYNFNAASKILNIQHNAIVKKVGNLDTIDFFIVEQVKGIVITQSLRNAPYLSVRIHIDKAGAFYYNERVFVIFQRAIHEEIGLVYDRPLILHILDVKPWPIYNHTFAKT